MPRADVGVVGAGLAGLTAAGALAEAGATVHVLATGSAATHWAPGGIDVAVVPGARSGRAGVEALAARPDHPYRVVGATLPEALDWLRRALAGAGLELVGGLDGEPHAVPTAVGATRPAAILPAGMAAALEPWQPGETLVVCGVGGFRDFWPEAIAASLRRPRSWRGTQPPDRIGAVSVELEGLAGRRNLNGLDLARAFDDPAWRGDALDSIARALDRYGMGPGRVALPAVLGLDDHPAVLEAARERLPLVPFEVPLVPPSVPGIRLFRALRGHLRENGGRIQIGEAVHGTIGVSRRVTALVAPAAAREFVLQAGAVVLATGGIAGGGIVAEADGSLVETVLGLPVSGPPGTRLLADPFDPTGHPLETAGVATDGQLRPVAPFAGNPGSRPRGRSMEAPLADNVRIVGSLLAGQRYLRERSGDGVALASGLFAARSLGASATPPRNDDVPIPVASQLR